MNKNNRTTYTAADASSLELIKYGRDHVNAATLLLKSKNLMLYDSAGFLVHLGVELFLKAVLLEYSGVFPNEHNLVKLSNKINASATIIPDDKINELKWLDALWNLKYPNLKNPTEIGTDDVPRFNNIVKYVSSIIPEALLEELKASPDNEKGGRTWMERPEL